VDDTWNKVAQLQQVERALVRDNSELLANGEPGGQYVLAWRRWILVDPVKPTPNAVEAATPDMV
jgi:hypothetical protein